MKIVFIFLLSILFLISCSDNSNTAPDLIEQGTMMNSTIRDTCLCDDLVENASGNFLKEDSLFTGVCVHYYPQTTINYMAKNILQGKLHGMVTYFDKSGDILVEEMYENGKKKRTGDGGRITCDCSDLEKKKIPNTSIINTYLDDIPFTGKCLKKYPDSDKTYIEVTYKDGVQNGYTSYFDKQGRTLYMESYEKGELIKVIQGEN